MSAKRIIITFLSFLFCFITTLPGQNICHADLILEGQFMKNGEKLKTELPVKMTVRIYNDEFGGELLFEENQEITVSPDKAVFTFEQGNITVRQRTSGLNTANLWVEVESDGQVMTPRLNLAETDTLNDLTGESIQLNNASLRTGGTATLVIDKNGVTLGNLLNMGSQSIILDGVSRNTWPAGGSSTETQITALENRIAALETLLSHFSRSDDEITISGANLHIVNGTDSTGTVNGKGNLIIGYNEERGSDDDRSGSHNLVIGALQNYSAYGGLVTGYDNTISGPWASVSGGVDNTASGESSSVTGGSMNTASGNYSSVTGGWDNETSGLWASISGGDSNAASGESSSVTGGSHNLASGIFSSVSGGYYNEANRDWASISGGASNTASGYIASISGGQNNRAAGAYSFVGGGGSDNANNGNRAFADYSAVLGGLFNLAGDPNLADHSVGINSCISGGDFNNASGYYSSISGGYAGSVSNEDDWRAGDLHSP